MPSLDLFSCAGLSASNINAINSRALFRTSNKIHHFWVVNFIILKKSTIRYQLILLLLPDNVFILCMRPENSCNDVVIWNLICVTYTKGVNNPFCTMFTSFSTFIVSSVAKC